MKPSDMVPSWSAVATFLVALLIGLSWLLRRVWVKIRKERRMLREIYAYGFGADEIGYDIDDESIEDRLKRGGWRFSWLRDSLEAIKEDQREIKQTQRETVEALEKDIEVPETKDLPEWDPDRYRDETRERSDD